MTDGEFYRAQSPEEACELLARFEGKACLLAGGTDVMVQVNERKTCPEVLVYVGDAGLNGISEDGGNLVIGAATPYADIMGSALVQEKAPILVEAIGQIASPAIRSVGTIGGNLGTASPAADSATPLLALGASVKIVAKGGGRIVPLEEFFTGPGETVLKPNEMIAEILIPAQSETTGWAYRKLGRRKAQSLSVVSAAITCPQEGGVCRGVRIALGAVAPTPMLATGAAALLEGKAPDAGLIAEAAQAAAGEVQPIDDGRSTAWYRKEATAAIVRQLLTQIAS